MSGAFRALAREAAARYPAHDRFARHFAYGKLTGDPVFEFIAARRLIPDGARVLDLGAGQGLLGALLAGRVAAYRAIERDGRDARRAREALPDADVIEGDARSIAFGTADAIAIIDLLHYLDAASQLDVLARARAALAPGGVLLLRVADAAPTWRFRMTIALDRLSTRLRGKGGGALHCRPLAEWIRILESHGLPVEAIPMSAGTPFANVLLVARYDSRAP